ncbi:hypothetical protein RB653_003359 [Dictyostelium firmibasis]|uniref:Pentatricopeptide repeat-containing protein n=1 Tax=Dictyostelium firmibasis TaxID=79012 RepID=A0AAN7YWY3_9MYCE
MKRITNVFGIFRNNIINLKLNNSINSNNNIKNIIKYTTSLSPESVSAFSLNRFYCTSFGINHRKSSKQKFLQSNNNGEENFKIYKSLVNKKSDKFFYSTILNDFYSLGQYNHAIKVFNEISGDPTLSDKYILSRVISIYSQMGEMEKCLEIFNDDYKELDEVVGTMFITGYLKESNFEEAMKWFEKCNNLELKIDSQMYMTLILKLSKIGQYGIIDMLLNQMESKKLKCDDKIYTALFSGLQNFKGEGHLERLEKYYQQLKKDVNLFKTMDSILLKSIVDAFYSKKQYSQVTDLYYEIKPIINNFDISVSFVSIIKSFKMVKPKSHEDIIQLWSSVSNPKSKHYSNYFNFINSSIEYGWYTIDQFNLPDIIEVEIEKIKNKNQIQQLHEQEHIFQTDIFIINQIINWHLIQNDIPFAWSIFQYTLTKSLADVKTFFYVIKYLSTHSTNPIVYNNIKEIVTSSYYIYRISKSEEYKKVIWIPILKHLSSNEYQEQLMKLLKLLKEFTFEDLSFYSKSFPNTTIKNQNNNNY